MLSSLDREKKDHYILTALAKDNPGDVASNRRENSVQVRVTRLGPGQGAASQVHREQLFQVGTGSPAPSGARKEMRGWLARRNLSFPNVA